MNSKLKFKTTLKVTANVKKRKFSCRHKHVIPLTFMADLSSWASCCDGVRNSARIAFSKRPLSSLFSSEMRSCNRQRTKSWNRHQQITENSSSVQHVCKDRHITQQFYGTSYHPKGGETICPPPTAVWLTADLHLSADGSAVRTWITAGSQRAYSLGHLHA